MLRKTTAAKALQLRLFIEDDDLAAMAVGAVDEVVEVDTGRGPSAAYNHSIPAQFSARWP